MSKKSKMIAAVAFVLGSSAFGVGVSQAAATHLGKNQKMSAIIEAIAEEFDLNASDVESVVQEVMQKERQDMEKRHDEELSAELNQAITDGKLTQVQADLIHAKKEELKSFMIDFKDLTSDERQALRKSHIDEITKWMEENDIPKEFILSLGKGHSSHHFGSKHKEVSEPEN